MTYYRIEWRHRNGTTGHGEWTTDRAALEAWVAQANREYPDTTHWIVSEER